MERKVTISDIARLAGVSTSSVSCYLNHPQRVGAATAARIRSAVERTKFRPSYRRPGPKSGERVGLRSGNILFLDLSCGSSAFTNCLAQALRERKLRLLFGAPDPERPLAEGCDGAILFGECDDPEGLKRELETLPVVHCRERNGDAVGGWKQLACDNGGTALLAVEFLLKQGHKKVAVFNPDTDDPLLTERASRFVATARRRKLGTTVIAAKPQEGPALRYRHLAGEFLRMPAGITGAFFVSDEALTGVWQLLRYERKEPDLRYLIGCGNNRTALSFLYPRPATIDLRLPELASLAVEEMLSLLRNDSQNKTEITLKPILLPGDFEGSL